jgi:periplasmic divalent cation tolerance protein
MTTPMKPIAVVTTIANRDEARKLALALVERGLAACAQISEIESVYAWKGTIQQEPEFRILFKTTDGHYDDIARAIGELHAYELPAIHAFAFAHVDPAYADWIAANTKPASG